jgi:predicted deacylase
VTIDATTAVPVESALPDLAPYRAGNTGIPFVSSFAASAPGPHVLIMALTHGNEICGAIALDRMLRGNVRPARGTLTLAFANVAAYERFDRDQPQRSRLVDEDFNRVWDAATLDGPRRNIELDRARELRPLIDRVDLLLDLHSMTAPSPPIALAGMSERSMAFARRLGVPEIVMRDPGHADGTRLRDYGAFGDLGGHATALLLECGPHWQRATAEFAFDATMRFLATAGTIDRPIDPAVPQRLLDVTHAVTASGDRFSFVRDFCGLDIVAKAGTPIARDGDREITTPYDDCVVVMPSASAAPGQTAVRLGRFRL